MPYANNNGCRIRYQVEGMGPPLVLHHGTVGNGENWKHFGYVDVLKGDRQLILVDARGHGKSDKPHDSSAYDLSLCVRDVTTVLDDLGISRTDYFGYSLGGWVGFGLAKYSPERIRSLILAGAHPYAESMQLWRDRMPQEPAAFMAAMEKIYGSHMMPAVRADLAANDLKALLLMTRDRTSLADILPTMTMPCLLFDGETDPRMPRVQECAQNLARGTFFSMPGCDHVGTLARSDLALPHVMRFLAEVERSPAIPAIAS
jgi:pimeloyl-ACP methyl ester carboxylesterase